MARKQSIQIVLKPAGDRIRSSRDNGIKCSIEIRAEEIGQNGSTLKANCLIVFETLEVVTVSIDAWVRTCSPSGFEDRVREGAIVGVT